MRIYEISQKIPGAGTKLVTPQRYVAVMEYQGWTPDRIEGELVRLEAMVSRIRAVQARLVDEAGRQRLPFQDGARSLVDWTAGRLDITREPPRIW